MQSSGLCSIRYKKPSNGNRFHAKSASLNSGFTRSFPTGMYTALYTVRLLDPVRVRRVGCLEWIFYVTGQHLHTKASDSLVIMACSPRDYGNTHSLPTAELMKARETL